MAYSTNLPPALVAGKVGAGTRIWMYEEAATGATIDASGYISNAYNLGMRVGDLVFVYNSSSKIWTSHVVVTCASRASPAADLSNGTTIADGTSNSD